MKANGPAETRIQEAGPDAQKVQQMFGAIAHRYDFLNHFLSASIDKRWRKLAVQKVGDLVGSSPNAACLDLCSGTGDLALEIHRRLNIPVVASDFSHPMLTRSSSKFTAAGFSSRLRIVEADALHLPFRNAVFDAVTIGFGLRNLANVQHGLDEIGRVLKPGGSAVILEFSKPVIPVLREIFGFYFRNILPRLGAAISGDGVAYRYLHDSVQRFPSQKELSQLMTAAGFSNVGFRNLSGGIAAIHWGIHS
jgi:demethylmenaquinone methyltransferase/2-methoxy-6-polyprenyl-1,4-benzoquinol methylase